MRAGGPSAFGNKALIVLSAFPLLLLILLIRLVRPILLVRFGALRSNRIGILAFSTENFMCGRDPRFRRSRSPGSSDGKRTLDLFFHLSPICNYQLKKMWDRVLHVSPLVSWLYRVNHLLPGAEAHVIQWGLHHETDIDGLFPHTLPHLSFNSSEEAQGQKGLYDMGIPDGAPFVCFHSRDPAYLESYSPESVGRLTQGFRDCSIHNYLPAAAELTKRGYFSIRMGSVVAEPMGPASPMVIDYAGRHRTDFLDIYLSAKCRFFLSSESGMWAIPMIFRKPVAMANYTALEFRNAFHPQDLVIPKKLWLRGEKRFLTFREIIDSGVGRFASDAEFEEEGIDLIENTPEEITALALEMDDRINGTWEATKEDDELQEEYWSIFRRTEFHAKDIGRLGAEFLRQNRGLLA
jgi:putative glycosyltransferase (TIGR04372 family)